MKRVYIYTNGCERRELDAELFRRFFEKNNWIIVNNCSDADLILVNTCAVNKKFENLSIKKIVEIQKRKKQDSQLIVCGCLPKINKIRLKKVFTGISFTPSSINKLNTLVDSKIKIDKIRDSNKINGSLSLYRRSIKIYEILKNMFFGINTVNFLKYFLKYIILWKKYRNSFLIRISYGCLGSCSFCGIKRSIGKIKSKPIREIINELEIGLSKNYKYFILLGDDVGAYGTDINTNFTILLEQLLKINKNFKVYITAFSPKWLIMMFPRLKRLLKSSKVDTILIPIQSGNDRVLKMMKRGYKIRDLQNCLIELKKNNPSIKILATFMVGFPSETEKEFNDTINLIKKIKFDTVRIHKYFDVPYTISSSLPNKVPEFIKKTRINKLLKFCRIRNIDCIYFG